MQKRTEEKKASHDAGEGTEIGERPSLNTGELVASFSFAKEEGKKKQFGTAGVWSRRGRKSVTEKKKERQ